MSSDPLLIIYLRRPELGKVKTRLAREIGEERAKAVYEELLDLSFQVYDRVPEEKQLHFAEQPGFERMDFSTHFQLGKDLGARMRHSFKSAFEEERSKVVLVGSDCPDIRLDLIEQAFTALDEVDLVLGPAEDGGYYLLGMRTLHSALFEGITWSSDSVLSESLIRAQELGLEVKLLETLYDIDTLADLKRFKA